MKVRSDSTETTLIGKKDVMKMSGQRVFQMPVTCGSGRYALLLICKFETSFLIQKFMMTPIMIKNEPSRADFVGYFFRIKNLLKRVHTKAMLGRISYICGVVRCGSEAKMSAQLKIEFARPILMNSH